MAVAVAAQETVVVDDAAAAADMERRRTSCCCCCCCFEVEVRQRHCFAEQSHLEIAEGELVAGIASAAVLLLLHHRLSWR